MYCGNCGEKIDDKSKYCSECGETTEHKESKRTYESNDIINLEKRVNALEKLGINNPSLIKRSFTTYGYLIVSQIIVLGVLLLIFVFLGLFE